MFSLVRVVVAGCFLIINETCRYFSVTEISPLGSNVPCSGTLEPAQGSTYPSRADPPQPTIVSLHTIHFAQSSPSLSGLDI